MRTLPPARVVPFALLALLLGGCAASPSDAAPLPSASTSQAPEPSPTAEAPNVADLACDELVDAAELAALLGADATANDWPLPEDPATLGGLTCGWRTPGIDTLHVGVFPAAVVPNGYATDSTPAADCEIGRRCEAWETRNGIWVTVTAGDAVTVRSALDLAHAKVEGHVATVPEPDDARWALPTCDALEPVVVPALGRSDLTDYAGDAMPSGATWNVLEQAGAVTWCAWHGVGEGNIAEQVSVYVAPGSRTAVESALQSGWEPVTVGGAAAAAYFAGAAPESSWVVATTGENTVQVYARFLSSEELTVLASAMIESLDAR